MKNPILAAIICIPILLTGCSKPRIDTSSDTKFEESLKSLSKSLNPKQQAKFDQALKIMAFDGVVLADMLAPTETIKKIKDKLKDKSYDDIVEAAKSIVRGKISVLNAEKDASDKAKSNLQKIQVIKSRITTVQTGFIPDRNLYLRVKNGTDKTLSEIGFNIKTFAPNREVPYLNDNFKYEIPGGIKAGETLEWNLRPNTFGNQEWKRDIPNGTIKVEALGCIDANGKSLWENSWTTEKEEELKLLNEFLND